MFDICVDVFAQLDLPININKCHCIRIGPRFKYPCSEIQILKQKINWVDSIEYLGIVINRAKQFECSWKRARCNFFKSANTILGRLGTKIAIDVTLKLIYNQSLPSLLYGTAAATITKTDLKDFQKAYDSVFAKLFSSYDKNILLQCQYFSEYWSLDIVYDFNRLNFLKKLTKAGKLSNKLEIDCID